MPPHRLAPCCWCRKTVAPAGDRRVELNKNLLENWAGRDAMMMQPVASVDEGSAGETSLRASVVRPAAARQPSELGWTRRLPKRREGDPRCARPLGLRRPDGAGGGTLNSASKFLQPHQDAMEKKRSSAALTQRWDLGLDNPDRASVARESGDGWRQFQGCLGHSLPTRATSRHQMAQGFP
ncbi:hypothetical protein KCP73_00970 [Salmonella enterica subsp. enterica]|nr:hypothetical protein KCP73_00970 [Salmonella enterica subsp. enterica]